MSANEITRPLNELFEKIYQTEKETLETQQKMRDLKKQINTVRNNIQQLRQSMHDKEADMVEQEKKKTLSSTLKELEAECVAKAEEKETLQKEHNDKHNAFCAVVESLEKLFQNGARV
ncbi:hypothetical protein ACTXT7_013596 [Hymenolepis weldensis]